MNWKKVNLTEGQSERGANILNAYTFDTLLLEIKCNLRVINKETIKAHYKRELILKMEEAMEILADNIDNIERQALEERNSI